jgi:serine protease Do
MDRKALWTGALVALLLAGASGCSLLDQARTTPPSAQAPATPSAQAPAGPGAPAPAQVPVAASTPQTRGTSLAVPVGGSLTVREVAERIKPAAVQIVTELGARQVDPFSGTSARATGIGTGIVFDNAGHILTNNHVVAGARSISVALPPPDGRTFDAKLIGTDPDTDLAVIQIQADNLPVATLGNSDQLAVGDGVVAIGNALGLPGGPTVTAGVTSALGRTVPEPSDESGQGGVLYDAIQTDAAINPGNSGGPLADMNAQVVGINTMVATQAESGVPAQGIGFAIAINSAKPIAEQLVTTGRAVHPYLGIQYEWVGGANARQLQAPGRRGVLVVAVQPGSPAGKAGLQRGDIITAVDGQPLTDETALPKYVQKHKAGDTIQLTVVRNGQDRTVAVILDQRPSS